jgi:hypothetical protein
VRSRRGPEWRCPPAAGSGAAAGVQGEEGADGVGGRRTAAERVRATHGERRGIGQGRRAPGFVQWQLRVNNLQVGGEVCIVVG